MKHSHAVPALAGLLLLSLAPPGQAQGRSRLPCAQVVRMGLDRYVARFTAATHDDSTAGNVEACDAYARCRRSLNDARARALPAGRRAQIAQARVSLDALAGACYEYTYLASGGGTMWRQIEAGDHAVREDFLAGLIAALHKPARPSPKARRQADTSLGAARRSLAALGSPRTDDRASLRSYRDHTRPAAEAAFARLQALVAALPDAPARRLAREVQHEMAGPRRDLSEVR